MELDTHGVRPGQRAWTIDGRAAGRVIACAADRFEVERGFFFPRDYAFTWDMVRRVDARGVTLRFTARELADERYRLDTYGRGVRGVDGPSRRHVGLEVPGDLGEPGVEEVFPQDQAPGAVEHFQRIVVHPSGEHPVEVREDRAPPPDVTAGRPPG